jgi:2'-5' RNA ligase
MEERYSFLMIDFKMPKLILRLQERIPKDELYFSEDLDDDAEYGLETESHVTLAPCLENDLGLLKELKKVLKPLEEYKARITDISIFENEEYDVLKCSISSEQMVETNSEIGRNFEMHTEYSYHPHMTIAYMKKGMAKKYRKYVLDELVELEPNNFAFGYRGENGEYKRITWK